MKKYGSPIVNILRTFLLVATFLTVNHVSPLNAQASRVDTIYVMEKYNPIVAGVSSYLMPGLGHIYCQEHRRAIPIFAGYLGSAMLTFSGHIWNLRNPKKGNILIISGIAAIVSIQIWSTVDAVKLAKKKNQGRNMQGNLSWTLSIRTQKIPITSEVSTGLTFSTYLSN